MGGKVSIVSVQGPVNAGIKDLGDVIEYCDCVPIGESREDDDRRAQIQQSLTPFQKQQTEVNKLLREMKDAARIVQRNKMEGHIADPEKIKENSLAKKKYANTKIKIEKEMKALEEMLAKDKKDQEKNNATMSKEDNIQWTADYTEKAKTVNLFREQIGTVDDIQNKLKKQHDRLKAREEASIAVDELGQMPDLHPDSWKNYARFLKKDREIDAVLEEVYKVNVEMLQISKQIAEEGKKQDILVAENQRDVSNVLAKARRANKGIDKVKDAIDGKGAGRICVYAVIIVLIIAVAYGIYTIVNGSDPCKDYNNQECSGLSEDDSSSSSGRRHMRLAQRMIWEAGQQAKGYYHARFSVDAPGPR